jgi:hypothetical protein
MASKKVKVYPYQVTVKNTDVDFSKFTEVFQRDSVNDNIVKLYEDETPFLLIIDGVKGNFLRGKFMHLRKNAPPVLNLETHKDKPFHLEDYECLEEISHFIWNLRDQVLFAESNYYAIRYFTTQLQDYLNEIYENRFAINDVAEFQLIPDCNTIKRFTEDPSPRIGFKVGVAAARINVIDEQHDLSMTKFAKSLVADNDFYLTYSISAGRGKKKKLNLLRKKVDEQILTRVSDESTRLLKVETENAIYDLLRNDKVVYSLECEVEGNMIEDANAFYDKAIKRYGEEISILKEFFKIGS